MPTYKVKLIVKAKVSNIYRVVASSKEEAIIKARYGGLPSETQQIYDHSDLDPEVVEITEPPLARQGGP